jgi:hypothetical protein
MLRYVTLCISSRAWPASVRRRSAALGGRVIDRSGNLMPGTAVPLVFEDAGAVRFGTTDSTSVRPSEGGCGFWRVSCAR